MPRLRRRASASVTPGNRRMRSHRWSAKRSARAARQRPARARRDRRGRARRSWSTRPSCPRARVRWRSGSSQNQRRERANGLAQRGRIDDRRARPRRHRPGPRNLPRPPSSRAAYRPDRRAGPSRVGDLRARLRASPPARRRARQMAAAPGGTPRGNCTSGRCGCLPSSRSRPRGRRSSPRRPDTPSSSAPTAGCGRARGRGSPASQGWLVTLPSRRFTSKRSTRDRSTPRTSRA